MTQIHLFENAADALPFAAGTAIFEQGGTSEVMYAIAAGEVSLTHNDRLLATLTAGTLVGEMALLEQRPHYVTAVAQTDCKLVPIDRRRFQFLVEQTPYFAIQVMTIMAERLQRMNQLIADT